MTESELKNKVNFFFKRVKSLTKKYGKKAVLALSDYETELDYYSLMFDPEDNFTDFKAVNAAIVAEGHRRGLKVILQQVRFVEYQFWLQERGFENSPANRAAFVSQKTYENPGQ